MSNLGGYSTVITSFFGLLLSSYQAFVFDKSMLKKLYFQQHKAYKKHDEDGNLRNDEDEIIERINNRAPFWFGYISYTAMAVSSRCLCCCKKAVISKWPFYKRQWISYQKFKQAREDLRLEKDIEHMIYN